MTLARRGRPQRRGIRATLDILGEHIHNLDQAQRASQAICTCSTNSPPQSWTPTISIKLTQLGLKVDARACLDLTSRLVTHARRTEQLRAHRYGRFVVHHRHAAGSIGNCGEDHSNVGVVIQAYLRRTVDDVAALQDLQPNYRLCKGVYVEPPEIAIATCAIINRNYA